MSKPWRRIAPAGPVGCFCFLLLGCGLGYGLLYFQARAYREQTLRERELIEPVLASDPVFANLRCGQRSNGGVYLEGTVPTRSDRERLSECIIRLLGETRAREVMSGVSVGR